MESVGGKSFCRAFTLIELLVVVAIIGILVALLLPVLKGAKARAKTVQCLSQLKQIGVASVSFATENNDRFPPATMPNTNRSLSPFQAVLKEAGMAKLFLCPADLERIAETNLTSLDRSNTSYFASYSARLDQPQSIAAGDRNITLFSFIKGFPDGIPGRMTGAIGVSRTNTFGWWRDLHHLKGNLLLGDGSVHATNPHELNVQIQVQPTSPSFWYVPNGDTIWTPYP